MLGIARASAQSNNRDEQLPTRFLRPPPRREYTTEFKMQCLREAAEPNKSIAEISRKHGMHTSNIFRWRREYMAGELPGMSGEGTVLYPRIDFAPVRITDTPPDIPEQTGNNITAERTGVSRSYTEDSTVEIVLGNGICVRVNMDVNETQLARLLVVIGVL